MREQLHDIETCFPKLQAHRTNLTLLPSCSMQQLLNALGTAKDVGDNVGVIAGTLYDYLPIWALLLWGSAQNILGYGGLWLAASGRAPKPPFWLACVLICVGEALILRPFVYALCSSSYLRK